MDRSREKPVHWIGSARKDIQAFPEAVRSEIGYALWQVQRGETPLQAKPLHGFGGATVLEIVDDYATDTYRAVYTVRFADVVYVLHAFQKKARHGRATPQRDMELIKRRLLEAQADYQRRQREQGRSTENGA